MSRLLTCLFNLDERERAGSTRKHQLSKERPAGAQPSGTTPTDEPFGKKNIHRLFCKLCGMRGLG
jgi:hypothetical protein